MAITRYAGDRFVGDVNTTTNLNSQVTGVLDGAFYTSTGNLKNFVKRAAGWAQLAGGGGGSTDPAGADNQVQFNDNGVFGATTGLTFDGQRLYANNFQLSGILYDSNASVGEGGMVLANEGTTGVHWKNIESVLSGVGGSGVANYVARWSDEDTLTSGTIYDNGNVGIGTAVPGTKLHVYDTVAGDMVTIESTNPNHLNAPDIVFYRNSASPADSDDLGVLKFRGRNNASPANQNVNYAQIEGEAISVADGAEGGALNFHTHKNGTSAVRMVITGDYVGIGTPTPQYALEVAVDGGEFDLTDSGDSYNRRVRLGDSSGNGGYITVYNDSEVGNVILRSYGDSSFTGGNVGIGITAPDYKLEVKASVTGNWLSRIYNTATTSNPSGLLVRIDDADSTGMILGVNNNGTYHMVVKGDGNVGIGSSNPAYKLDVRGDYIFVDDGKGIRFGGSSHQVTRETGNELRLKAANTTGFITFLTGGGSEYMRIAADGKVGIGTNAPATALDVADTGTESTPTITVGYASNAARNNYRMAFYTDSEAGYISNKNGNNGIRFQHRSNTIMQVGYGGNATTPYVGIGTPTPEHHLHVSGDAIISGYLYDSTNSTGTDGYVFTTKENGPRWEAIEDVLSGVGGNGTANYVPKWEDSDTIGNSIIYDNGSNIGIGNAVPSGTLDIVGSNGTVDVAADGDAQELIIRNNDRAGIQILSSESSSKMGSILFGSASDANGANISYFPSDKLLRLGTQVADGQVALRAANGVEAVRIDENGNVGIGANDPSVGLQVGNSVVNETKLVVFNSEGGVPAGLTVKARVNRAKLAVSDNDSSAYVIAEGLRAFFGATDSGTSTNIAVQTDGNVGIGTTDPGAKLEVNGDAIITKSSGATKLRLFSGDDDPYISFGDNTTNWAIGVDQTDSSFKISNTSGVPGTNDWFTMTTAGAASFVDSLTVPGLTKINPRTAWGSYGRLMVGDDANNARPQLALVSTVTTAAANTKAELQFLIPVTVGNASASGLSRVIGAKENSSGGNVAGYLSFETRPAGGSMTERVRIASDGNVGIGDNLIAPEHRLHVSGDAIISGVLYDSTNSSGVAGHVFTSEAGGPQWKMIEDVLSGVGGNGTADYVPRWTDSDTIGDSVISQSGSNIGINMTAANPATELHIGSLAAPTQGGNWASLSIGEDDYPERRTQINAYRSLRGADWDHMGISFQPHTSSSHLDGPTITGMVIDYDGHVGIGTTTPSARLMVSTAIPPGDNTAIGLSNTLKLAAVSSNAVGRRMEIGFDQFYGSTYSHSVIGQIVTDRTSFETGDLYFATKGGTTDAAPTERMRIQSDGKVGIGTNAPTKFLHVRAPASSTGGVIALLQSHDTANGWLQIQGNAGNSWEIGATDSGFQFYDDETAAYKVTIKNSGDVGIGVSSLKTWYAGITQLALGSNRGTVVANASYIGVMENAYLNASAAWKKVVTGGASNVWQDDGTIYLRTTATGGNADDTITWNICAMDSSGEFGIGTSSPAQKLHVVGDAVKFERTNNAVALQLYNTNASPADDAALGYLQFMGKDNDGTANIVHSEVRGGVQSNSNTAVNGYLAFSTTNNGTAVTEWMRIKADGNVGIGTNAPDQLLHLQGSASPILHVESTGDGKGVLALDGDRAGADNAVGQIRFQWNNTRVAEIACLSGSDTTNKDEGVLGFFTAPAGTIYERMRITSGGRVGIGTNNPDFDLQANATNGGVLGVTRTAGSTTGVLGNIRFGNTDVDANLANIKGVQDGATDSAKLVFQTEVAGGAIADRMVIKSDGKVGIGTDAPDTLLDLQTAAGADMLLRRAVGDTSSNLGVISFGNADVDKYLAQIKAVQDGATDSARLEFQTEVAGGAKATRMTIKSDGNVGIGTNSPGATLTLSDGTDNFDFDVTENVLTIKTTTADAADDQAILIDAGNGGLSSTRGAYIHLHGNEHSLSAGKAIYQCGNVSTSAHLFRKGGGTDAAIITSDGNVGVGTTAPKSLLEASGVIRSTHATSVSAGVGIEMLYNNTDGTGYLYSYDRDGSAYKTTRIGSESYFIADGNVGIATATPEHQFQVYGDALISGKFYDSTNSTGDKGYVLTSDDTGPLWAASGDFDGLSGNLIATGQTLQTQITSNDTDIAANTANLITTGQTLQTQITANDGDISTLTSNLITTGQTLQTQITANDGDISTLTSNLITTGQTLQTQITSNDTDIATNATNIATNVTNISTNATNIATNVTNIATNASNLILTGNFLESEIDIVSGLIPATVIDGGGTANKVPLWSDANTIGDSVIAQSGSAIGIGTTAPTQFLDILATQESDAGIRVTLNCNLDSQAPQLVLNRAAQNGGIVDSGDVLGVIKFGGYDGNSVENSAKIEATVNGTPSNDNMPTDLSFYTASAGSPVRAMTIDKDQQVGIGTTAPGAKLEVRGATETIPNLGTYGTFFNLRRTDGHIGLSIGIDSSTNHFWFQAQNSTSPIAQAIILNPKGGNVGIGTNNPSEVLDVDGNIAMAGNAVTRTIWNKGYGGAVQLLRSDANATRWAKIGIVDASGNFVHGVTILNDGNVGIGTVTSAYKLRVEGDVYISGTLTEASSVAIKENIETYSPSLEIINKLRPVRYNKKKSKKKEVGLVAEELAEMFPELVETDEKGNPSGVNYSRAVAVLLHGFKELYKEVKELKEKI